MELLPLVDLLLLPALVLPLVELLPLVVVPCAAFRSEVPPLVQQEAVERWIQVLAVVSAMSPEAGCCLFQAASILFQERQGKLSYSYYVVHALNSCRRRRAVRPSLAVRPLLKVVP